MESTQKRTRQKYIPARKFTTTWEPGVGTEKDIKEFYRLAWHILLDVMARAKAKEKANGQPAMTHGQ